MRSTIVTESSFASCLLATDGFEAAIIGGGRDGGGDGMVPMWIGKGATMAKRRTKPIHG